MSRAHGRLDRLRPSGACGPCLPRRTCARRRPCRAPRRDRCRSPRRSASSAASAPRRRSASCRRTRKFSSTNGFGSIGALEWNDVPPHVGLQVGQRRGRDDLVHGLEELRLGDVGVVSRRRFGALEVLRHVEVRHQLLRRRRATSCGRCWSGCAGRRDRARSSRARSRSRRTVFASAAAAGRRVAAELQHPAHVLLVRRRAARPRRRRLSGSSRDRAARGRPGAKISMYCVASLKSGAAPKPKNRDHADGVHVADDGRDVGLVLDRVDAQQIRRERRLAFGDRSPVSAMQLA